MRQFQRTHFSQMTIFFGATYRPACSAAGKNTTDRKASLPHAKCSQWADICCKNMETIYWTCGGVVNMVKNKICYWNDCPSKQQPVGRVLLSNTKLAESYKLTASWQSLPKQQLVGSVILSSSHLA